MQCAEGFAHLAVLERSVHGYQSVQRLIAERLSKRDFFLGGCTRGYFIWRAELRDQLLSERFDDTRAIRFIGCHDLDQRGPAERLDAEECPAEGRSALAIELRHIVVPEHKCARDRPFAGLCGALEHKRVRGIKPDGAQQFHFGPRVFGSSHEGTLDRSPSFLRSTSTVPMRRTR